MWDCLLQAVTFLKLWEQCWLILTNFYVNWLQSTPFSWFVKLNHLKAKYFLGLTSPTCCIFSHFLRIKTQFWDFFPCQWGNSTTLWEAMTLSRLNQRLTSEPRGLGSQVIGLKENLNERRVRIVLLFLLAYCLQENWIRLRFLVRFENLKTLILDIIMVMQLTGYI